MEHNILFASLYLYHLSGNIYFSRRSAVAVGSSVASGKVAQAVQRKDAENELSGLA